LDDTQKIRAKRTVVSTLFISAVIAFFFVLVITFTGVFFPPEEDTFATREGADRVNPGVFSAWSLSGKGDESGA
jgi:hypothetical protein